MIAAPSAIPVARPRQPGKRDYLSWSAISAYRTCPLKFYFRYVAELPEETVSASLVFGAAIHRAVEHHFRELLCGAPSPALSELVDHYQAEWDERDAGKVRFTGRELRPALDATAHRLLAKFQESDVARPQGTILAVEEELRGKLIESVPDVLGKLDLIVETPSELVISDWKTSRARWSEFQVEDAAEQLLLYAELTRDFAPGKALRIEFVIFTKTKEATIDRHTMPVEAVRLDRTKRVVARVWQAIQAEHFYPAPSPMACGGCPFRQPCRKWKG